MKRMKEPPPQLAYTDLESTKANLEWKASCGPHSLAAALGLTLEDVKKSLKNYRGWMNPTQMRRALDAWQVEYRVLGNLRTQKLCTGINRIQWEGPWLNPGVPARVAYRYTHWVAHFRGWVLCTACTSAMWIREEEWRRFHLEDDPPTPFHITHHYELS